MFWKRIIRILWHDSFDIVELLGSFYAFGWGLWFITHPGLFDGTGVVYDILSNWMDETAWGIVLLIIGLFKLLGVAMDRYRIRRMVAWWTMIFWGFIALSFFSKNPNALLCFVAFQHAFLAAWEFFRHSRKARIRQIIREDIGSNDGKI